MSGSFSATISRSGEGSAEPVGTRLTSPEASDRARAADFAHVLARESVGRSVLGWSASQEPDGWGCVDRRESDGVLVVIRFEVPEVQADAFADGAAQVVEALARQPGYRFARVGRAADDPAVWVLVTEWDGARAWRKAMSAFDVRIVLTPLTAFALDEPGAFEVLLAQDGPAGPVLRSASARAPEPAPSSG